MKHNLWEKLLMQDTQSALVESVKKLIVLLETVKEGSEVLDMLISQTFGNMEEAKNETMREYSVDIPLISSGQVIRFFEFENKIKVQLVAPKYFVEGIAHTTGLAMAILSIKICTIQLVLKLGVPKDSVDFDIKPLYP